MKYKDIFLILITFGVMLCFLIPKIRQLFFYIPITDASIQFVSKPYCLNNYSTPPQKIYFKLKYDIYYSFFGFSQFANVDNLTKVFSKSNWYEWNFDDGTMLQVMSFDESEFVECDPILGFADSNVMSQLKLADQVKLIVVNARSLIEQDKLSFVYFHIESGSVFSLKLNDLSLREMGLKVFREFDW